MANIKPLLADIKAKQAQFIERFMEESRKTWIPGCHEGSQNSSGDTLRALDAVTISVLDVEDAEFANDND